LATRIRHLHRSLGAFSSHGDPLPDLLEVCSGYDAQVRLSPEAAGQDRLGCFSPPQGQPGVLGQQIGTIASDLPQLRNDRVQVVDLATGAIVVADADDTGQNELVGAAHPRTLEHMFDSATGHARPARRGRLARPARPRSSAVAVPELRAEAPDWARRRCRLRSGGSA
jgi:hypothetical protein